MSFQRPKRRSEYGNFYLDQMNCAANRPDKSPIIFFAVYACRQLLWQEPYACLFARVHIGLSLLLCSKIGPDTNQGNARQLQQLCSLPYSCSYFIRMEMLARRTEKLILFICTTKVMITRHLRYIGAIIQIIYCNDYKTSLLFNACATHWETYFVLQIINCNDYKTSSLFNACATHWETYFVHTTKVMITKHLP